ncbi:MAG: PEP-CTERM sorting domain-containing protein [Pirellulaceae bacterium]|nr:PEP-CTERM sorting domain-containing protein [Pirellulaceae bacterium]
MKSLCTALVLLTCVTSAQAWTEVAGDAMIDSYGNSFGQPPTANPSGNFSFVNANGDLLVSNGGLAASGQAGWADPDNTAAPQYGIFWSQGWGGWPNDDDRRIVGHGPSRVQFTVPAFDDAGSNAVKIDASISQLWEADREMQLLVDGVSVVVATPADSSASFGSTTISATPGQVIDITLAVTGNAANPADTFVGWNATITEVPEPATIALLGFGLLVCLWRRRCS